MNRHRIYGPEDEQPTADGDTRFTGVDTREPAVVAPGFVSHARNLRFRDGVAATRRGIMKVYWGANSPAYNPNQPFEADDGGGAAGGGAPERTGAPDFSSSSSSTSSGWPQSNLYGTGAVPNIAILGGLPPTPPGKRAEEVDCGYWARTDGGPWSIVDAAPDYTQAWLEAYWYELLSADVAVHKAWLESQGWTVDAWDGNCFWVDRQFPDGATVASFYMKVASAWVDPPPAHGDYRITIHQGRTLGAMLYGTPPAP